MELFYDERFRFKTKTQGGGGHAAFEFYMEDEEIRLKPDCSTEINSPKNYVIKYQ